MIAHNQGWNQGLQTSSQGNVWLLLGLLGLLFGCQQESSSSSFLRLVPESESGINFQNQLVEDEQMNIIEYLYFYNGGGVAAGDINNDGLPDLYFSANQGSNLLYLNQGDLRFEDITEQAGVAGKGNWSTGVSMVDINADGWLDIYLCQVGDYKQFEGKNQLFLNQGVKDEQVSFVEVAEEYGLDVEGFSTQAAFLDYDGDGDLDMYLLKHSVHSTDSYRDTSYTRQRDPQAGDQLFRNDLSDNPAAGRYFVDVSEEAGILGGIAGYGLGVAVGDIDKNGCPDLYISNDFHENDFLYLNNCDGTFTESASKSLRHTSNFSMGNDLADINNDGWLDVVSMDMKPDEEEVYKNSAGIDPYDIYLFKRSYGYDHQFPRNMLQLNQGIIAGAELRFSEVGELAGIAATDWTWGALMADLDNDGNKDLFITNGIVRRPNDLDYLNFIANQEVQREATDLELASQMPKGRAINRLYMNAGDATFTEYFEKIGKRRYTVSHGSAYADLDADGDLDLIVNNLNEPAHIFENKTADHSQNHFLQLKLEGPALNPKAVGAKLTVYHGDNIQYQEMYPVRSWQSSSAYGFHVGVGRDSVIDSLRIEWGDGTSELHQNIKTNQSIVLSYEQASEKSSVPASRKPLFVNISKENEPLFRHVENQFLDNKREALIPYLLSTQGPFLSVGDLNGDLLDDIVVGGASLQVGTVLIQQANGEWLKQVSPDLQKDSLQEDTGISLFDADQDGDLDLYIGSGGNQFYHQHEALKDRLYLNDGTGNFDRSPNLPDFFNQTSCVVPADIDGDGDIDLFVGSRGIPVNYGVPATSYLLLNDGKGSFDIADEETISLNQLGMVTDAIWTDVDEDLDLDLVVVGEWMPVTIFENQLGRFERMGMHALRGSSGWWNCIESVDLDNDGDEDWVLGNFGLNSVLQASRKEPVRLYVRDFDNNLSKDPILTYYRQHKEYTVGGLDELSKQLVQLKKRFRTYHQFAGSGLYEVFPKKELDKALTLEVQTFASAMVINEGQGNRKLVPLPGSAQWSPVFGILAEDFDGDAQTDILLGGNFYEIQPAIGRMDASYGVLLTGNGKADFEAVPNRESGLLIDGQVRDMKMIQLGSQRAVVIAKNNAALQVYLIQPDS